MHPSKHSFLPLVTSLLFLVCAPYLLVAQPGLPVVSDSDSDGISDAVEQSLLTQFAPTFMVSRNECAGLPAEFISGNHSPAVQSENGTIYGEVFPLKTGTPAAPRVEIHFYHLWKQDCGAHGHALDAEHVSLLAQASTNDLSTANWKALYWYAAAHQNTVCDVSQIGRASTLGAEEHGATVWISAGKHASFLNERLCERGCGGDVCEEMTPMVISQIVNLGEPSQPMNGSVWMQSNKWALAAKMNSTDFPAAALARLTSLPATDIAWFNAGKHPMQGTIAISGLTADTLMNSGHTTAGGISVGEDSAGNALKKSYRNTVRALGSAKRSVGKALRLSVRRIQLSQEGHS